MSEKFYINTLPKPPAPIALEPEREKRRFFNVLLAFFRAVAGSQSPLIIFLDDLQWSDLATIELLQFLLSQQLLGSQDGTCYWLIVGGFREEEVSESHPLTKLMQELKEKKIFFKQIRTTAFSSRETEQVIKDTFGATHED
jgi:predicted ATPase